MMLLQSVCMIRNPQARAGLNLPHPMLRQRNAAAHFVAPLAAQPRAASDFLKLTLIVNAEPGTLC